MLIHPRRRYRGHVCRSGLYAPVRVLDSRVNEARLSSCSFRPFPASSLPYLIFDFHPMTAAQFLRFYWRGFLPPAASLPSPQPTTRAPAREVSVFDYTQIVFAAGLGFLFFGQLPDILSVIGYCIISGVAIWMFLYNLRKDHHLCSNS